MQLKISISILVFSFLLGFGLVRTSSATRSTVIATQDDPDSGPELIEALDDCIQQRFQDVDQGFGFRRIVKNGETPHRFKPENARELSVVGHLTKDKLDVVLYLAGRDILNPESYRREVNGAASGLIKGPVFITGDDGCLTDSPTALDLLDHRTDAAQAFKRSERYDFAIREWKIIVRPVRASDVSCLKCHQSNEISTLPRAAEQQSKRLQLGDPLGELLYAYRNTQ